MLVCEGVTEQLHPGGDDEAAGGVPQVRHHRGEPDPRSPGHQGVLQVQGHQLNMTVFFLCNKAVFFTSQVQYPKPDLF